MARPRPDSGSIQVTVAIAAALVLLAAAFLGAGAGILGQAASACQAQPAPSTAAATIPAAYLADYQQAGARYGIPWTVLAGIGEVESGQGRSDAPGVHSGTEPRRGGRADAVRHRRPGREHLGRRPHPPRLRSTPAGTASTATTTASSTSTTPATPSPPPPYFLTAHGAPARHPGRAVRLQPLRRVRHRRPGLGRPLRRRRHPGTRRRAEPGLRAGRPRAAARRDRRESHRLRRSPARQALPVGRHRPGRLRLLRAGHDGLPRRRDHHPPHQPAAMGLRPADPRHPRPSPATWCSSPAPTAP